MTPFSSVAMLEKLALLKMALCSAPALSSASSARLRGAASSMAGTRTAGGTSVTGESRMGARDMVKIFLLPRGQCGGVMTASEEAATAGSAARDDAPMKQKSRCDRIPHFRGSIASAYSLTGLHRLAGLPFS